MPSFSGSSTWFSQKICAWASDWIWRFERRFEWRQRNFMWVLDAGDAFQTLSINASVAVSAKQMQIHIAWLSVRHCRRPLSRFSRVLTLWSLPILMICFSSVHFSETFECVVWAILCDKMYYRPFFFIVLCKDVPFIIGYHLCFSTSTFLLKVLERFRTKSSQFPVFLKVLTDSFGQSLFVYSKNIRCELQKLAWNALEVEKDGKWHFWEILVIILFPTLKRFRKEVSYIQKRYLQRRGWHGFLVEKYTGTSANHVKFDPWIIRIICDAWLIDTVEVLLITGYRCKRPRSNFRFLVWKLKQSAGASWANSAFTVNSKLSEHEFYQKVNRKFVQKKSTMKKMSQKSDIDFRFEI